MLNAESGMRRAVVGSLLLALCPAPSVFAQVAARGKTVHTLAGPPLTDGVVVLTGGKIAAVGPAASVSIPDGYRVIDAEIVTPGLIDAHATVGLTGILNMAHDQDQLERSEPVQPQLRALDAYNPQEELVAWVRSFGITTVHTGHAPGELVPGQTFVVKTVGNTVDEALVAPAQAVAVCLGTAAQKDEKGQSPGTRGKMMAMLRTELVKAQEYLSRREKVKDLEKQPTRDLKMEVWAMVLSRELPLLVTAHRAQDIASALRLAAEFNLRIILDGAAEAYLLLDDIKKSGVPVIIHPLMQRAVGECENLSFETPVKLRDAGIPFAFQSGFEGYVPKTRVVLFEAAIAAANGLTFQEALSGITLSPARILGLDARVGSLEVGKDADLALFDGDPFEYTTHCTAVIIGGRVVSQTRR